jgi:hypothetical protein
VKSEPLNHFKALWLAIFLIVVQPSLAEAQGQVLSTCEILLSKEAEGQSISSLFSRTDLVMDNPSVFKGQQRSAYLAPEDSWARGETAKHLFVLSMRVSSNEEALNFINALIREVNTSYGANWESVERESGIYDVPDNFTARVHSPYYTRHIPTAQGSLELEIEIQQSKHEVAVAEKIAQVLLKTFNLQSVPVSLRHLSEYDLTTSQGRAAWGYEAFHEWLQSLSKEARTLLGLISGAEYRDILPFLRGSGRNGFSSLTTPKLKEMIVELDAAIERGQLPVSVRLFRASADPHTLEAWSQLSNNSKLQPRTLSDSAYTFTSLDEKFVQSWNRNELRGRGIIIEIEASEGLRAGYIDRGPHDHDYAEIILARGQTLTPIRAYTDTSGVKRLVVTAH